MRRSAVDRIISGAEILAACFLAAVVALTFVSVVLRYGFAIALPDSYDASRLFLGILIFWGIAATGFRGEHITVDLIWGALGPRGRRVLDVVATLFTLGCMVAFTYAMTLKVLDARHTGEATYDLRLPVWPFYAVAWLGIAGGTLMLLTRLARQVRGEAPTAVAPASH